MDIDEQVAAEQQEAESGDLPMPGTSPHDPLTYDPTQGTGTNAWEQSVRRQHELNTRLQQNAQYRRN